jgi:hypothetical protein
MARSKKAVTVSVNTKAKNNLIRSFSPMSKLQRFIDNEVYRLSDPYTPRDTGALLKSPTTNKAPFGCGRLIYSIYGKKDGRNTWNDTTSNFQDGPTRGPFWTARMLVGGGAEKLRLSIKRFIEQYR